MAGMRRDAAASRDAGQDVCARLFALSKLSAAFAARSFASITRPMSHGSGKILSSGIPQFFGEEKRCKNTAMSAQHRLLSPFSKKKKKLVDLVFGLKEFNF